MRVGFGMALIGLLSFLAGSCGAEPEPDPRFLAAENKLLRRQLDTEEGQIALLRADNERLRKELREMGVNPSKWPSETQSATTQDPVVPKNPAEAYKVRGNKAVATALNKYIQDLEALKGTDVQMRKAFLDATKTCAEVLMARQVTLECEVRNVKFERGAAFLELSLPSMDTGGVNCPVTVALGKITTPATEEQAAAIKVGSKIRLSGLVAINVDLSAPASKQPAMMTSVRGFTYIGQFAAEGVPAPIGGYSREIRFSFLLSDAASVTMNGVSIKATIVNRK